MSELIVVGTGSETIHGTFNAAKAYVAIMYGETYTAWTALADDPKKQTLAAAVRFMNQQQWAAEADTFAEREALQVGGVSVFHNAQYEFAVMIAADPGITAAADQGNNIRAVAAGGASVEYFNPTTQGAALLPPILMRLIGQYLAAADLTLLTGNSQSGSSGNPFSECHEPGRKDPF